MTADQIAAARRGSSEEPKTAAALRLTQALITTRNESATDAARAARAAGLTDEETAEVIGHMALNTLTNYFNALFNVDIHFPVVEA